MSRRRLEDALRAARTDDSEPWRRVEIVKEINPGSDVGGVFSFQFSMDGQHLVAGFGNGGMMAFDAETGAIKSTIRKHRYGGLQILAMRFNPKQPDTFLAASAEGKVYQCTLEDEGHREVIREPGNEINCLDFNMDGYFFATAGKDMSVRLYDTKTQKLVREWEGFNSASAPTDTPKHGHGMRVFAMRFHPENADIFITGGWENHLKVWDTRTDVGVRRTIMGPHICGDSLDIKGWDILTGSWVATDALQTWDYSTGSLKKSVPFRHDNGAYLYCAQFAGKDCVLAGGSGTNSVQAVNAETGEVIGEVKLSNPKKPIQALDSTHSGRRFAVGGGTNAFLLCQLSS